MSNSQLHMIYRLWCNDRLSENVLYQTCLKLSSLTEYCIMEEATSHSPEIKYCNLKNVFPNMLPKTFLDFISDMGVNDQRHYDRLYRK